MKIIFLPADPSLAEFFYEQRQDPVAKRYNPLMPSSVETLRERLSKTSSDWSDFQKAESFFWFLEYDSKLIGTVSLHNINRMMLTAEIGYGISPTMRGKGYATQAITSLTRQVFAHTQLRKLIAFVHEENHPSRTVLEKIGYKNEGLLREHYLINGEPVNEVVYGILRQEFK